MPKASALVVRLVALAAGVVVAGVTCREASAQRARPGARGQAQGQGQGGAGDTSQPLNLQKEQLGSAVLPDQARARMRAGDCKAALDIFDHALETLTDPTIRRDRGLCHEKLGHLYPAIDDYRVYLTEAPDATDVAGITDRLHDLEAQARGQAPREAVDDDIPAGLRIGEAEVKAETDTSKKGSKKGSKTDAAERSPAPGATRSDKIDYVNADEDALHTPLRAGEGVSLAPLLSVHKWFFPGYSFGDSQTWAESVAIQVRYSFNPGGALVVEAGYEQYNSTSIDPSTRSGLTSQVAYELRFPIDPDYDNQFLLTPGLGYQHLGITYTDGSTPPLTKGAFVPRVRFGWRHMLQASTALDVGLDLGIGNFFPYSKFPYDSSESMTGLVALDASVAWGL